MEQREHSSERLLLAISRVQSYFIDDAEPELVFDMMLQELLMLSRSTYGCIGEVVRDTEQKLCWRTRAFTDLAVHGAAKAPQAEAVLNPEFRDLTMLCEQVLTTGQPIVVNDPHAREFHPGPSFVHSLVGLPIHRSTQLIGVVGVANRPGGYNEAGIAYLNPFLSTCAQLLEGFRNRRLRSEAEQALRESEDRFRAAVQAANEGIWDWNVKTNEVYFSPRWKAMLGYDDHEIAPAYQEWESRLHPDDREGTLAQLNRYRDGKAERYDVEFRLRKKNGDYCWIRACGIVSRDVAGQVVRIAGSHTDISERKREEALQVAEKQALELVAKGTGVKEVLAFLCRTFETHTPPMLCSVMLVTEDETHLTSAAAPSLPEEYNRAVDGAPIGPTTGSCGNAAYFGKTAIVSDISTDPLWKDYAAVALAHGLKACWSQPIIGSSDVLLGTFAAYYHATRDPQPGDLRVMERASRIAALAIEHVRMTEALRESETRFQAFMHYSPAITFIKDEAGRHIYVNPRFESLFAVSGEQIRNKTVFDFMPTDIANRLRENDQSVFSSGQVCEVEETVPTRDGALKHCLVIKFPLETGLRRLIGGVAVDITERKRVEENLLRTQFAMDQAVDAVYWIDPQARILYTNKAASAMLGYTKEEFLRMTVHDLNPDFPADVWPGWWEEVKEKKVVSLETNHLTKDARLVPIDLRVAFLAYGGQEFHCAFVRDITVRKQVDQALRESQERFELAVGASYDGIWDWNILTGEQYWSGRHFALFGLTSADLTPTYDVWISLVHPDDAELVHQATRRHLDTREPYDIEMRVRMKDGSYRWFRDRGQAVWNTSGRPVRMVGCISDVTARRTAEETIWKANSELEQRVLVRTRELAATNRALENEIAERKRVEDRLQRTQYAVDHAADQIFVMDENGCFLDVNEAACCRLGYAKEELLTMAVMDIDPDFPQEVWDAAWTGLKQAGRIRIESRHRSKSGEIYPVEVMANYLCHGGQELDCAFVRDISERKRAEAEIRESELRYKLVTEATFDAIALHDNGVLLEVNTGLERMFGYQPGELLGRSVFDLLAEESHDHVRLNMQNGVTGPYEAVGRRKDGTLFPGELVVRPYSYHGKEVRLVAGRDITARKQLELQLERHAVELERLVEERTSEIARLEGHRAQAEKLAAVGQMAAAVAHEINNPIAGIRNAFTLVKQAVDPAHPHYEFVGMIDREITRVASIVQNMYQLYRKEPSKAEPVNLPLLLRDLEALFSKRLSQFGLTLIVTQAPLRTKLLVPQSDLLQILMNLIQNALDSSFEKGTIRLNVCQDADTVRIGVSDEGSGIPPDVLPHIFDPFFTTKTEKGQKGLGLGLAVSRSLVMAMGGKIEVWTEVGAGSTFSIHLPAPPAVSADSVQRNIIQEVLTHET